MNSDIENMPELALEHDWAATRLGPRADWSPVLRSAVDLVLAHGFPAVLLWGPDLVQIYNDGYRVVMGDKHPAGLGQPTRDCWPEVWHINRPIYDRVRRGETVTFADALYPVARHGELEDAWFTLSYSPVHEDGEVAGVLVTVFETTAARVAAARRDAAEAEMQASEERFRTFVLASSEVVYRMSPDWAQMRALDGRGMLADTKAPREDWRHDYLLDADWPMVRRAIDAAIAARGMFELEHRVRRADGETGWVLSRAAPILDADGDIVEWLGAASDITARKRAEEALRDRDERLTLLVGELQHRTRNLLAVVSGVADQTLASSDSLAAFGPRFDERLAALGRVQGLLSTGPLPVIDLRALLTLELNAHGVDPKTAGEVDLAGPDVALPADAVQLFALALHELTTNALKHGALGRGGRLQVRWRVEPNASGRRRLALDWAETGLPTPPVADRRGFGRELIEDSLPFELDAATTFALTDDGVRCTLALDLPPSTTG